MNILDKIIAHKRKEVTARKAEVSIAELEKSEFFSKPNISMKKFLKDPHKSGIIAEFKRKSPSKGWINEHAVVSDVVKQYEEGGASGISVLTDNEFFGGSDADLKAARGIVSVPILRKDFIVDEYQIVEAKAMGANVILLIAAALNPEEIKTLSQFTRSLGMEVLLEVHDEDELLINRIESIDIIGVNNRSLKTFEVDLATSLKLSEMIPQTYVKISESGISTVNDIIRLKQNGFEGFLIGENFMKTADPGKHMKDFAAKIIGTVA